VNTSDLESTGQTIYEGFVNYVNALFQAVTSEMPKVLEKANNLPQEAEEAQASFQPEIDKLDFMKKG
jgi:hypothetical protein